jgi:hypothetical protein
VFAEKMKKSKELLCQRREEEKTLVSGSGSTDHKKYVYFDDLLFLQPNLENSTTSNLDGLVDVPYSNNSEESGGGGGGGLVGCETIVCDST